MPGSTGQLRARSALASLHVTPVEPILPWLDQIDLLLLDVEPAFGGQPIQAGVLLCLAETRSGLDQERANIPIAINAGVKPDYTAAQVGAFGEVLVMGSGLFGTAEAAATFRGLISLQR